MPGCSCSHTFDSARLELTTTEYLRDPETLESSNAVFKLGFFSRFNLTNRYLGIWYNKEDPHALEVVWVANRRRPINDSSAVLKISWDGNLQLFDGQNKSIWSSNVTAKNEVITPVAQLRDTGKLVLLSKSSGNILWQSVDHPTNLVLPLTEVSFDENTTTLPLLASWKSPSDPSNGRFTAGINHRNLSEIFIWDGEHPYWRSGPWDGHVFIGIQSMYYSARDAGFQLKDNNDGTFILSFSPWSRRLTEHYALADDGVMLLIDWVDDESWWGIFWKSLESECDIYGKCGVYGRCNSRNLRICTCLQGFEPTNSQEWSAGNWSSGCARRTPLQCGTIGGKEDGFFRLRNMKVPDNAEWVNSDDGEDCRRLCLQNCSCLAYAYQLSFGCMIWSENLIDIQDFSPVGVDLYIRLAHPELGDTLKSRVIIAVIVIVGSATLGIFLYYLWRRMNQNSGKTSKEAKWKYYLLSAGVSHVELNEFQDFPLFNFGDLVAATNNFSENTKLGRGGFGIVYKGTLKDGQEIAVKRLSTTSVQGVKEFINEVLVISKLQHRNLVRLLGCCIEGEEKLLIYEYMPNKSLDAFLFDLSNQEHLDWKKRFNVIKGIIRGLLYLHRDSRLRIIHRDLKASNVLLDGDFNPKISDFGMARIFGGNQDQGDTKRIVGTYGYMSPEYAMEGRFSEKSDVFSFGVLLLEIVSGRKNNSFKDEETLNLLGHAWKLWNENSILALIDTRISEFFFQEEILRCIRVGLLSVQELPEDRPSISMVLSMIESEVMDLPHPTQPGFAQRTASWKQPCFTQRAASWNKEQQNGHECYSVNGVSITSLGGR